MAEDEITYIDLGDRTLEIDNRGPVQQRRVLPKSQRDIGISQATRDELEERVETEIVAPAKLREEDEKQAAADRLPPVVNEEDARKRDQEVQAKIAEADKQRAEDAEASQQEVAKPRSSGKSS